MVSPSERIVRHTNDTTDWILFIMFESTQSGFLGTTTALALGPEAFFLPLMVARRGAAAHGERRAEHGTTERAMLLDSIMGAEGREGGAGRGRGRGEACGGQGERVTLPPSYVLCLWEGPKIVDLSHNEVTSARVRHGSH